MSPEGFDPSAEHPEVKEDLEAVLPMSEGTRQDVMTELSTRVEAHEPGELGDVAVHYELDDPEYEFMAVYWRTDNSDETLWEPDQIGQVTVRPRGSDSSMLVADYDFYNAPDGVQIERHTNNLDDAEEAFRRNDVEGINDALDRNRAALEEERELGLTTVNEAAAKRLLQLIRGAQRETPL